MRHPARDFLTKLTLVAGGFGVTTLPPGLLHLVPDGVRLVRVSDGPPVLRRASIARLPACPVSRSEAVDVAVACLHEAASVLPVHGREAADRRLLRDCSRGGRQGSMHLAPPRPGGA